MLYGIYIGFPPGIVVYSIQMVQQEYYGVCSSGF